MLASMSYIKPAEQSFFHSNLSLENFSSVFLRASHQCRKLLSLRCDLVRAQSFSGMRDCEAFEVAVPEEFEQVSRSILP